MKIKKKFIMDILFFFFKRDVISTDIFFYVFFYWIQIYIFILFQLFLHYFNFIYESLSMCVKVQEWPIEYDWDVWNLKPFFMVVEKCMLVRVCFFLKYFILKIFNLLKKCIYKNNVNESRWKNYFFLSFSLSG